MKMRTILAAYQYLKENDPESSITLHGLRSLVNRGTIKSISCGRKKIICIDDLGDLFKNTPETNTDGIIKQIKER